MRRNSNLSAAKGSAVRRIVSEGCQVCAALAGLKLAYAGTPTFQAPTWRMLRRNGNLWLGERLGEGRQPALGPK